MNKQYNNSITHISLVLFFIYVGVLVVSELICSDVVDMDMAWHYKLGDDILKTLKVTTENTYTFQNGTEWVQQEWLFDTLIALLINTTGFIGFLVVFGVNHSIQAALSYKMSEPKNKVLWAMYFYIMLKYLPLNFGNRPAEFSVYILLLAVWLYETNKVKNIYKLLIFIALGIFSANFHGGVLILVVASLLIMVAVDLYMGVINNDKLNRKYLYKMLFPICYLSMTWLNPSGFKMLEQTLKVTGMETTKYIAEWKPIEADIVLASILCLVLISIGYSVKNNWLSTKDYRICALLSAFTILGLTKTKAFMPLSILYYCYSYKYVEVFINELIINRIKSVLNNKKSKMKHRKAEREESKSNNKNIKDSNKNNIEHIDKLKRHKSRKKKARMVLQTMLPSVLTILITANIYNISNLKETDFITVMNNQYSPETIQYLKENTTNEDRIFSWYHESNILLLNNIKVFVDSRQWPYVKETGNNHSLDDMIHVAFKNNTVEEVKDFLDEYKFDYLIFDDYCDFSDKLDEIGGYTLEKQFINCTGRNIGEYKKNLAAYKKIQKENKNKPLYKRKKIPYIKIYKRIEK